MGFDSLYDGLILSAAVIAPAAEDHREGTHTFEQQRGHGGPQV